MTDKGQSRGVGRPLKYPDVEELQENIDAYFTHCDAEGEPYTITGLALWLGTYRQTLLNYEGKPEFVDTIKMAKQKVEYYSEKALHTRQSPTGAIFALKNFGWSDNIRTTLAGDKSAPIHAEIDIKDAAEELKGILDD